jgi:hypothetical protein
MPGSVHSELPEVLRKFTSMGVYKSAAPYGMGHINDTFKVNFEDECGRLQSCIVQRINHHVFKQPVQVMENIEQVTSHLQRKIVEAETGFRLLQAIIGAPIGSLMGLVLIKFRKKTNMFIMLDLRLGTLSVC